MLPRTRTGIRGKGGKIMRLTLAALALCSATIGGAAHATTYIAYDAFNVAGGAIVGSGPFSFGFVPPAGYSGSLPAFSQIEAQCGGDANVQCARNSVVGVYKAPGGAYDPPGTNFYDPGELLLHPGASGEQAGIRFTALTSGLHTIAGTLTANDVIANQKNYTIYYGDNLIGSGDFTAGPANFSVSALLNAGETLTFLLGFGNDGFQNDSTGVALSVTAQDAARPVPEPATWLMLVTGFGLIGATLRVRRSRDTIGVGGVASSSQDGLSLVGNVVTCPVTLYMRRRDGRDSPALDYTPRSLRDRAVGAVRGPLHRDNRGAGGDVHGGRAARPSCS